MMGSLQILVTGQTRLSEQQTHLSEQQTELIENQSDLTTRLEDMNRRLEELERSAAVRTDSSQQTRMAIANSAIAPSRLWASSRLGEPDEFPTMTGFTNQPFPLERSVRLKEKAEGMQRYGSGQFLCSN